MPLTLPQGGLQPFFHIDVKIMENKLLSCLRTREEKQKHVHLSDLKKHVACCLTFGFNACKMSLTLPQGAPQPFFYIDLKIMENKLLSCLRTREEKQKHVHLSDLKKHVACCLTFGFNACKMSLTLPQGAPQPFFYIDLKIMENKLLSCLRTQ